MLSGRLIRQSAPTVLPAASGWTSAAYWAEEDGDLTSIAAPVGGFPGNNVGQQGFVFSPDGTKFTLGQDDGVVRTFTCSTPFDPSTGSVTSSYNVTNLTNPHVHQNGNILYGFISTSGVVGAYLMSDFAVTGSGAALSSMADSEVSLSSAYHGPFATDGSHFCWGDVPNRARTIQLNGSLDNFSVIVTDNSATAGVFDQTGYSCFTKNGKQFIQRASSPAGSLRIVDLSTPYDVSTAVPQASVNFSNKSGSPYTYSPEHIWFDPNDTTFVWTLAGSTKKVVIEKWDTTT